MCNDYPKRARELCREPVALLTLDLRGINRVDDVEVRVNETLVAWNGNHYNHYDHGCWNDILQFPVPARALRQGENAIGLRRLRRNAGFEGAVEVRKCVVDLRYPSSFAPGVGQRPSRVLG